ncbi:hypothetical protein NQ315_017504 [Exocentrus adspersus]|uniref:DNA-directed DNA polymerase n=1 Tax=Exocentrus adspersus TaxID=1586481 RepID=A0AAV8VK53_9CUCU|nr:hypothetical protein NQ315_017504 [Exocentrus adspersus]
MPDYNPNDPSNYLLYFNVNALYSWAVSQYLPYGGFKWVSEIENFDVLSIPNDSDIDYMLEVDLSYPNHLHDSHEDLPLCPEHRTPPNSKLSKLMTTLHKKERYVVHYTNLKQYLECGMKLDKIHRILQFNLSPWLKVYVDLNARLRANFINEFEKNLFKSMLNAVFGKTMENIRKYRIVKLLTSLEGRYGANHYISNPAFHSSTIFDDNLVVDDCKLLYTDTDSLIYSIKCDAFYEIIKENLHKFDTSDFKQDNPYCIPRVNKKMSFEAPLYKKNPRYPVHFDQLEVTIFEFEFPATEIPQVGERTGRELENKMEGREEK